APPIPGPAEVISAERRTGLVFTGLLTVGSLFGLWVWRFLDTWPWPWAATLILNTLLFLFLLLRRPASVAVINLIYTLGTIGAMVQVWLANEQVVRKDAAIDAFLGYKIFAIGMALLMPSSKWVGIGAISLTAVLPVLQTYLWTTAQRQHLLS